MNNNYAVCWIGYKSRPSLEKCIASISRNKKFDTYAYIDNCGNEIETSTVKKLFLKYFPNANINVRPINYKLDLNVVFAMHETFSKGYDGIFYCEDDIFFDNNAFETLENLADWAKTNVPEAAVFHSWNYNLDRNKFPKEYDCYFNNHRLTKLNYNDNCTFADNEVGFTGQNHWGALITRRAWNVVAPYVLRHYKSYLNAKEISMKSFDFKNFLDIISKAVCIDNISNEYKKRMFSSFDIKGWEAIYEWSLCANGLLRLALTNPRSMCVESEGTDFKGNAYQMLGLDKIRTINSPNTPTEFIMNEKSRQLFTK